MDRTINKEFNTMIMPLWIDYIDWKMTTFYETNKSKFDHTINIKDVYVLDTIDIIRTMGVLKSKRD